MWWIAFSFFPLKIPSFRFSQRTDNQIAHENHKSLTIDTADNTKSYNCWAKCKCRKNRGRMRKTESGKHWMSTAHKTIEFPVCDFFPFCGHHEKPEFVCWKNRIRFAWWIEFLFLWKLAAIRPLHTSENSSSTFNFKIKLRVRQHFLRNSQQKIVSDTRLLHLHFLNATAHAIIQFSAASRQLQQQQRHCSD